MQKRSHKLLAATLLESQAGFRARRFELAFLFGSFQPDCNPFTYLRGSLHGQGLHGHNFSSTRTYISRHIQKLQRRQRWHLWQYYTLGKLTHYLADAFTYPHNDHFPEGLLDHHRYETDLRRYLEGYLGQRRLQALRCRDLLDAIEDLHRQYLTDEGAGLGLDARYILTATSLLMGGCLPA